MQRRFRIASTDEFSEAVTVKEMLSGKFPDKKFQIRRTHKGFKIVERTPVGAKEAEQYTQKTSQRRKGKRRGLSFEYDLRTTSKD